MTTAEILDASEANLREHCDRELRALAARLTREGWSDPDVAAALAESIAHNETAIEAYVEALAAELADHGPIGSLTFIGPRALVH